MVQHAIAASEEPPDPASFAIIATSIAATAAAAVPIVQGASKPKAPSTPKLSTPVGESTTLKPGEKTNLINTSPQGVLSEDTSRRQTLLGG